MKDHGTKIQSLEAILPVAERLKASGKKIVLTHGIFDLLHYGHMHYLKQAKQKGDILMVSMVTDAFVRKGPNRPVFDERVRAASLAFLECVDYVIPCKELGPWEIIKKLKPHLYAKGDDSVEQLKNPASGLNKDKKLVELGGGSIYFTKSLPIHSTELIRNHFNVLPQETLDFLASFKKSYSLADLLNHIQELKKMKVLVIGEAIIDEYRYVTPLGKPTKSNIISAHFQNKEEFAGGALACANHLTALCDNVDLVTYLGEKDSKEKFIRSHLNTKIKPKFFYVPDQPTIIKRRFVDQAYYSKLFEECVFDRNYLPARITKNIHTYLDKNLSRYDLVLIVDYGHGFLSKELIDLISKKAKFLAVNAQTNSGNSGFNYIIKYPRIDYASIDEIEARLAAHDNVSDIKEITKRLAEELKIGKVVVTLGPLGSLSYDRNKKDKKNKIAETPSFAFKITDTVGSGDAFLALSAPCAAAGLPIELVSFMGNVAGSIAVSILGNKSYIQEPELMKHLSYLLE